MNTHFSPLSICIFQTEATSACLLQSILHQMCVPKGYTVLHFRRQIAAYMAKHVHHFVPRMSKYLKQHNITFESYVLGVATGSLWGDKYIIGAIEQMFNLSISIVSPAYKTPWRIFHDSEKADIVIVSNGFHFGHRKQPTHFSPTEVLSEKWRKIGHDVEKNEVERVYGDTEGRTAASKMFILEESEQILKKHYLVSKKLDKLNKMVKNCEEELVNIEDELHEMKFSKDCFHRFKLYMDNMNVPNNSARRIPKITFPQILGKDIMSELQKPKSTHTTVSTEALQDVCEPDVNPDASIHVDLTNSMSTGINMQIDHGESSLEASSHVSKPDVPSQCMDINVDLTSDVNDPGVMLESNSDTVTHGNPQKCTDSVNSSEEISDVRYDCDIITDNGTHSDKLKSMDTALEETVSDVTADLSEADLSEPVDTVLSTETASDLNKSDMIVTSTGAGVPATGGNKRKKIETTDAVSPKARRQQLQKENTPNRFHCDNCTSKYKYRKDLLRHQREVCGKESGNFVCGLCGKKIFHKEALQDHLGKTHSGEKWHNCKFCTEAFFYRKYLNMHVKDKHQSQ